MPKSQQPSSPPPAYINHDDVAATDIEIPQIDSERSSTAPTSPDTVSIGQDIAENQVPPAQPLNKQDCIPPVPILCSNSTENFNTDPDKLLSKLEHAIQRLESSQEDRLITRLETVLSRQAEANANSSGVKKDTKKPIKLKDAVGRRFSFPYHRCETWTGIEELIKSAFLHVDIIGPHVNEGHYDIMNPAGEVILPQLWEDHVQPGWEISMSMWPMPGPPKPRYPPPPALPNGPPNAPVHVIVDRLPCPPPPPPACFRSHYPPSYSSDSIVPEKGIRGLWQKMKGIFTKQ
ncbi:hypothetical protein EAF04_006503 [Stromatinia cepivora]|nr:hypothetical protein EAF04_006503 [Stromatinia cepivora]